MGSEMCIRDRPQKAQFTTFVNWQLRGELQSLRFRLMTDQRPSAKKVEATTVSLSAMSAGNEGDEGSLETMIEDENALARTEAGASDYFADGARAALMDYYVEHLRTVGVEQLKRRARARRTATQPADPNLPRFRGKSVTIDAGELAELEATIAQHRMVVERRLFDDATLDEVGNDTGVTKERVRQITKSAAKTMAEFAASNPRFAAMGPARRLTVKAAPARRPVAPGILPMADDTHNRFTRVTAIDPAVADDNEPDDAADLNAVDAFPAPAGFATRRKMLVD